MRIIQETHRAPSFFIYREKRSRKPLKFLQKKKKECFTQTKITEIMGNIKNLSDCLNSENTNDLKNELNEFADQETQWDEKCYLCKSLKPFGGKYRHLTPHTYMGHSSVSVVKISQDGTTTIRHELKFLEK